MTTQTDLVSLRDYVDVRLMEIEKSHTKELSSLIKSLDDFNRLLSQLKDQLSGLLTRAEYEAKHEAINSQIHALEISKATLEGKASQNSVIFSVFIAVFGVILSIFALFKEFFR